MDNQKTGALIRQLRTDLGMTQKDLARQLAVTDRAVSKWERGVSLIVSQADGSEWRVIYGSCEYSRLWWAPDGNRYVLALETAEGTRLCLARLDQNSESNLNAYLTMGVQASELAKYDYTPGPDGWPSIRYEFSAMGPGQPFHAAVLQLCGSGWSAPRRVFLVRLRKRRRAGRTGDVTRRYQRDSTRI